MITATIFINGKPIYTRTAVNTGTESSMKRPNEYTLDTGEKIKHVPNKGAVKLAKKMLDTIKEVGVDD